MSRDGDLGNLASRPFPYGKVLILGKKASCSSTSQSERKTIPAHVRQRSNSEPIRQVLSFKATYVSKNPLDEQSKPTHELYKSNLSLQRQAYELLQQSKSIDHRYATIVSSIQAIERVQYGQLTSASIFNRRELNSYWHGQISLFHWIGLHAQNLHHLKAQFMQLKGMFSKEDIDKWLSCEAIYFNQDSRVFTKFTPLACIALNTSLLPEEQQLARDWLFQFYQVSDVCVCRCFGYGPGTNMDYSWEALQAAILQRHSPELNGAIEALNAQMDILKQQQQYSFGANKVVSCL